MSGQKSLLSRVQEPVFLWNPCWELCYKQTSVLLKDSRVIFSIPLEQLCVQRHFSNFSFPLITMCVAANTEGNVRKAEGKSKLPCLARHSPFGSVSTTDCCSAVTGFCSSKYLLCSSYFLVLVEFMSPCISDKCKLSLRLSRKARISNPGMSYVFKSREKEKWICPTFN